MKKWKKKKEKEKNEKKEIILQSKSSKFDNIFINLL